MNLLLYFIYRDFERLAVNEKFELNSKIQNLENNLSAAKDTILLNKSEILKLEGNIQSKELELVQLNDELSRY